MSKKDFGIPLKFITEKAFVEIWKDNPRAMAWCDSRELNYTLKEARGKCPKCRGIGEPQILGGIGE